MPTTTSTTNLPTRAQIDAEVAMHNQPPLDHPGLQRDFLCWDGQLAYACDDPNNPDPRVGFWSPLLQKYVALYTNAAQSPTPASPWWWGAPAAPPPPPPSPPAPRKPCSYCSVPAGAPCAPLCIFRLGDEREARAAALDTERPPAK